MMNDSKPNLKFEYVYRDGGNYKQYGEIVLANPSKIDVESASSLLRERLIDSLYFLPEKINIPRVERYPYDPELDHSWYEFLGFIYSGEESTDKRSVEEFIETFESLEDVLA